LNRLFAVPFLQFWNKNQVIGATMGHTKASSDRLVTLDGLRGIAILLVLFNHLLPNLNYAPSRLMQWTSNLAQSGWVGVDLFFVLSGFLITRILLEAKTSPNYFKNFYMRRVLRIFPLYFGALAVYFVLLPLFKVYSPTDMGNVWTQQAWNWTYCTNIGNWLDDEAGSGFYCQYVCLGHFWSLAVEEHFYLFWPALIYWTPGPYIKRMCLACIVASITIRFAAVLMFDASAGFFHLTPGRLDSLAYGGFIAASLVDGSLARIQKHLLVLGCVVALVLTICFFYFRALPARHPLNHLIGYSMYGAMFGALLIWAIAQKPGGWGQILLGGSFLVFFGKYSYGLYVIHGLLMPIFMEWTPVESWINALHSVSLGSIACTLTRISISTALALASWHLFEKHFLKLKPYFEYQKSTTEVPFNPRPTGETKVEQPVPI